MESNHGRMSEFEKAMLPLVTQALPDIIPGGIAGINMRDKTVLFAEEGLFLLTGYIKEKSEKTKTQFSYSKLIHPDDYIWIEKNAAAQLEEKGRIELVFRMIKKDGTSIWVKLYAGVIDSSEWGHYLLCLILDYSETETALAQAREAKMKMDTLINTIPGGFARLLVEDGCRILLASDGYYTMTGYTPEESELEPIAGKAINFIVQEDIPVVIQAIQQLIKTNQPVCAEYRIRKKDGSIAWNTAYCSKAEHTEHGTEVDAVFIDTTVNKDTENRLVSLVNSIPGGVVQIYVHDEIMIEYANDGFYRMIGYTQEEFMHGAFRGRYTLVIYPEDRALVLEKVTDFLSEDKACPSLDYRVICKNGDIRWMRASASRVENGLNINAQCVISDVTDAKKMEQQVLLNEERYRIICEQMQDIVFDWDIENDILYHSPSIKQILGYEIKAENGIAYLTNSDHIFKEDKQRFHEFIQAFKDGAPYVEGEYRVKNLNGTYTWLRVRGTTIFDRANKPIRAVGIMTDIDSYKQETAVLKEKAQKDSLTGLFNRRAVQDKIQARLNCGCECKRHALYLIDIDDFKWINDSMGHSAGDIVLAEISERMRSQFDELNIAGRLGGDEFAMFVEDIVNDEAVWENAECLNSIFRQTFQNAEGSLTISGSIGIALYPEHGKTFQELYEHADEALYRSKRRGKNCFSIYTCASGTESKEK